MRRILFSAVGIFGAVWFLLIATPLWAIDYDKIDRTILKEPVYQSGAPKYVLLLFGPQAKRVWVVIDGNTAYIDRNSDGDLTAPDKRFVNDNREGPQHWQPKVEIADPDGKTTYKITNMAVYEEETCPTGRYLFMNVRINGPVKFKQYSNSNLWDTPAKAVLTHFNGPLTIAADTVNY